ncbi:MAG: hypothetical protein ACLFT0_09950 [Spirulinaceae cyanobacterium]
MSIANTAHQELLSQNPDNAELLQKVFSWNFDRVKKRLLRYNPEMNVEKACQDFRYWVYLNLASDQTLFIPSFLADEFWHAALLFTEDWMAFSNYVAGEFLHHHPLENPLPEEEIIAKLEAVKEASIQHFGEIVLEISDVVCCM